MKSCSITIGMYKGFFYKNRTLYAGFTTPIDDHGVKSESTLNKLSCTKIMPEVLKVLTKDEYTNIVKVNRKNFVHREFGSTLDAIFRELEKDAEEMKSCHREVVFTIPYHFDIDKTEALLCSYFSDIGYRPLPECRKGTDDKITITLT